MLWQNPLALLGMLVAFSNAAPLAPLEGDIEDIINATYHSFDKRINEGVRYVFRTDGRDPKVLKSSGGFQTKGWTNGYREDVSLYRHCKGAKNGASMDDDGFVSTTWKRAVAEGWVRDHHKGSAWIYKIATDEGLIDVQATLKHYSPYPHEKEFAAIHSIPWAQVQGWYRYIKGVEYEYVRNKDFSQSQCKFQFHTMR
jgi:cholera enterotoxin subunit A